MKEDEHCAEKEQDKSTPAPRVPRKRNETIYMKILVPSCAVGAIIGKGGESIAQVQKDTAALIKLSKAHDLYPGTLERVCLIQGTREAVTSMHNYIMDRMLEKPDCPSPHCHPPAGHPGLRPFGQHQHQPGESYEIAGQLGSPGGWVTGSPSQLSWGRHKQVKILVPNCTAGLVIGKEGSYVKEIKERTGAFIQISQKSQTISLVERCITIAGEPDQCRAAVDLVIAKIAEDPQSTSCPTISYSHVRGPVASAYPTGSPFAVPSTAPMGSTPVSATPAMVAAAAAAATQRYPGTSPRDAFLPSGATMVQPGFPPLQTAALFHAALAAVTAGAGAGTSGGGMDQSRSFYAGFPSTSAPPPPPQQQQPPPQPPPTAGAQVPTGGASSGGSVSSVHSTPSGIGAAAEFGVYPAGLPQWPTAASPGHLPEVTPQVVGYETAGLAAPLNFAYYPAGQPLLTTMPSRHPNDVFPACYELFTASTGYQQQQQAQAHSGYQHHHHTQSPASLGAGQVYTSAACFGHTSLTDSGAGCLPGGSRTDSTSTPLAYTTPSAVHQQQQHHQQQQQLAEYLSAVHLMSANTTSTYGRPGMDQLTEFSPPLPPAPAIPTNQQQQQQQLAPPSATGAMGTASFAGYPVPQQFLPTAPGWCPSNLSAPLPVDHRANLSGLVEPHAVVAQQPPRCLEQPPPQGSTTGKLTTPPPEGSSSSSTVGCCSGSLACARVGGDKLEDESSLRVDGCLTGPVGTSAGDHQGSASPSREKGTVVERTSCSTVGQKAESEVVHPPMSGSGLDRSGYLPPASKNILTNGSTTTTATTSSISSAASRSEVIVAAGDQQTDSDSPKAVVALNGVSE